MEVKGKYDPFNVFGKPITAETPSTPESDQVISVECEQAPAYQQQNEEKKGTWADVVRG